MPTVYQNRPSHWRLQIRVSGRRLGVSLGRCSRRQAERVCEYVAAMQIAAKLGMPLDAATQAWLNGLPGSSPLAGVLADAGLIVRTPDMPALDYIDRCIEGRKDLAASSIIAQKTQRNRVATLLAGKTLRDVTDADAVSARHTMLANPRLSAATVGKTIKALRTWWRSAIREGLASHNPWLAAKVDGSVNVANWRFIEAGVVRRWMDALPDDHWRLYVALGRWAGLRLPSEARNLRHEDIDWQSGVIVIRKQKTQQRRCPLFPELVEPLRAVGLSGGEYVLGEHVRNHTNPSTLLKKALRRIGVTPWPDLMTNLRRTRATEVEEQHGAAKEAAWIGHTEKVSREHYLMVTDTAVKRATKQG